MQTVRCRRGVSLCHCQSQCGKPRKCVPCGGAPKPRPLGDAARRPLRPCAAGGSGSGSGGGYLMGYLREDLHTPPHTTNASHRTHHAQDSNAAATTPDQKQDVSTANVVLMCSSAHPIEDHACMVTVKYKPSDQQLNNASSFKGHHRRHSRLYSDMRSRHGFCVSSTRRPRSGQA